MHADRKCDGKLHFTLVFQTLCFQRGGGEKAQTQQRDGQKEEGKNAKTTETFFMVVLQCSALLSIKTYTYKLSTYAVHPPSLLTLSTFWAGPRGLEEPSTRQMKR